MDPILFLAHTEADNAPLRKHQLEALAATKQLAADLGADLHAGLVGADVSAAAAQLAGCGAARVLAVSGPEFASPRYASDAAAAATSRWNRVLPGVSQRLGGRADSHVTNLEADGDALVATRWVYRQRIETKLRRAQRPWLLAVESGIAPAFQPSGDAPAVESVDLAAPVSRTRVTGIQSPAGDQQTIRPDAPLLFVTGAGWTKKQPDGTVKAEDASQLILEFLEKSRASLGSTKSLVDMGEEGEAILPFLSHMNQVGQTGSTPRHPKGLATCCHGEEPHTVGWRFINERRAISLDSACGWARGKADVLYVADAFEVMRELNALL